MVLRCLYFSLSGLRLGSGRGACTLQKRHGAGFLPTISLLGALSPLKVTLRDWCSGF